MEPALTDIALTDPVQHSGDCFGVTFAYDITDHTDPSVYIEVEAFMSVDGGATWESIGKSGRIGGKSFDQAGNLLTQCTSSFIYNRREIEVETGKVIKQLPLCKDPLIKLVGRKNDKDFVIAPMSVAGISNDAPQLTARAG